MGSVMFRNRYWYYKSLYDDYIGREIRMSFGLTTLIWLPHYWYMYDHEGMESILTAHSKKTQLIKITLWNGILVEID